MAKNNEFERAARLEKAVMLADFLGVCGIESEGAAAMTAKQWELVAAGARTKVPSAETIKVVLSIMTRRERGRAETLAGVDAFRGF